MRQEVHGAGAVLEAEVVGAGPPVLLVHGMGDTAAGWEPAAEALSDAATVIRYDRRGYGASTAPEPYERTTVEEQAEDAAAVLRALAGTPAIVCGEDIGALVCLDLVRRHRPAVRAAVLVDPPLFALVPGANERLAAERVVIEARLRDGGPAAAAAALLDMDGHDAERRARGAANHGALFADWGGVASWPYGRRDLRAIDVALAVVSSDRARPHERAAAEALAGLAPRAAMAAGGPVAAVRALLA